MFCKCTSADDDGAVVGAPFIRHIYTCLVINWTNGLFIWPSCSHSFDLERSYVSIRALPYFHSIQWLFVCVRILWMAFNIPHSSIYAMYNKHLHIIQTIVYADVYIHRTVAFYLVSYLVAAKVIVPWLYAIRASIFRSFIHSLPSFLFYFCHLFYHRSRSFSSPTPKIFRTTHNEQYVYLRLVFLHFHFDFPFYDFQCARSSSSAFFLVVLVPFLFSGFLKFCIEVYFVTCLDTIRVFQWARVFTR